MDYFEDPNLCLICFGYHPLKYCKYFKTFTVQQRRYLVRVHRYCSQCFSKGHSIEDCPQKGACEICRGCHHTMLHVGGDTASMTKFGERSAERSSYLRILGRGPGYGIEQEDVFESRQPRERLTPSHRHQFCEDLPGEHPRLSAFHDPHRAHTEPNAEEFPRPWREEPVARQSERFYDYPGPTSMRAFEYLPRRYETFPRPQLDFQYSFGGDSRIMSQSQMNFPNLYRVNDDGPSTSSWARYNEEQYQAMSRQNRCCHDYTCPHMLRQRRGMGERRRSPPYFEERDEGYTEQRNPTRELFSQPSNTRGDYSPSEESSVESVEEDNDEEVKIIPQPFPLSEGAQREEERDLQENPFFIKDRVTIPSSPGNREGAMKIGIKKEDCHPSPSTSRRSSFTATKYGNLFRKRNITSMVKPPDVSYKKRRNVAETVTSLERSSKRASSDMAKNLQKKLETENLDIKREECHASSSSSSLRRKSETHKLDIKPEDCQASSSSSRAGSQVPGSSSRVADSGFHPMKFGQQMETGTRPSLKDPELLILEDEILTENSLCDMLDEAGKLGETSSATALMKEKGKLSKSTSTCSLSSPDEQPPFPRSQETPPSIDTPFNPSNHRSQLPELQRIMQNLYEHFKGSRDHLQKGVQRRHQQLMRQQLVQLKLLLKQLIKDLIRFETFCSPSLCTCPDQVGFTVLFRQLLVPLLQCRYLLSNRQVISSIGQLIERLDQYRTQSLVGVDEVGKLVEKLKTLQQDYLTSERGGGGIAQQRLRLQIILRQLLKRALDTFSEILRRGQ